VLSVARLLGWPISEESFEHAIEVGGWNARTAICNGHETLSSVDPDGDFHLGVRPGKAPRVVQNVLEYLRQSIG
jgi:hypothetical protein